MVHLRELPSGLFGDLNGKEIQKKAEIRVKKKDGSKEGPGRGDGEEAEPGACREPRRPEAGRPPPRGGSPPRRQRDTPAAFSPGGWEEVPRRGCEPGAGAALKDHTLASASVRTGSQLTRPALCTQQVCKPPQ